MVRLHLKKVSFNREIRTSLDLKVIKILLSIEIYLSKSKIDQSLKSCFIHLLMLSLKASSTILSVFSVYLCQWSCTSVPSLLKTSKVVFIVEIISSWYWTNLDCMTARCFFCSPSNYEEIMLETQSSILESPSKFTFRIKFISTRCLPPCSRKFFCCQS